jgi:acetylglutamate synthase
LEELFTKRGAGSLVSLGYEFNLVKIDEIDQQRLITLLEKGFLRKLKSNYFAKLRSHGGSVLLEKDYRGAIVIQHFGDFHYLDKVVVAPEFFGRGMGSILLDELTEHLERYSLQHPKLIWRAKLENPFLPRYASLVYEFARRYPGRCGTLSDGVYVYHFIGLKSQEREKAYELMRNYPSSFMTVEA